MTKEKDANRDVSHPPGLTIGDFNTLQLMGHSGSGNGNAEKFTILSLPAASVAAEISVPHNWLRLQDGDHTNTPRLTLRPSLTDSTLISISRHRDLPQSTASETFKALLARGLNRNESPIVFAEGVKSGELERKIVTALTAVLGTTMAGDNQLSNPYKHPDARAPIFHMEKMELKNLNGKTVLAVDGSFDQVNADGSVKKDAAGKPMQSSYTGIFAAKDSRAQGIEEIYMLSGDKDDFQKNKPVFNRMVKSVSWQRGPLF